MTQVDLFLLDAAVILLGLMPTDPHPWVLMATDLSRLGQLVVNGTVVGSILALAAVGLTMVYGILRIANFAHGDLLTLGTYLALYFFALLALPTTIAWATGTAVALFVLVALDRWTRPHLRRVGLRRLGAARGLSEHEAAAVVALGAALLVLVAGIRFPSHVAAGASLLVVALVVALPLVVRMLRMGLDGGARRRSGLWLAGAALVVVAAHLVVPVQTGPGGFTLATELALGVAVLAAGALAQLSAPGRDPWVVGTFAVGGALLLYLFAAPVLLSVTLALAGVALFSVLLERFVWRRARAQGAGLLTLIILSIGIMLALRNTMIMLWGTRQRAFPDTLRRGEPILGTDILITPHQALAVSVALLVILLLHLFLRHAKLGKAMRALADDMELARISGIQVDRVILYVWIIAGALAALAGILYGMVRPFDPNLGWYQLLPIFAAVILGGIGSPYGALLGGFTIGLAMETSPFFGVPTDYKLAVGFGILILVMIFRPRGILGVKGR